MLHRVRHLQDGNKNWTQKPIILAIVCLLVGVGIGLLNYHYFSQTTIVSTIAIYESLTQGNTLTNCQFTKIEPAKEMVERLLFTKIVNKKL